MSEGEQIYHLSEIFESIQGEGAYAGTMMTFLRFAGCSVGKKTEHEYLETCTLFDGRKFTCDTDFRRKISISQKNIIDRLDPGIRHVCITGGEPLNHELYELVKGLIEDGNIVHIETSGTVVPYWLAHSELLASGRVWLTVSPKLGCKNKMLQLADELKFLVDENFSIYYAETMAEIANGERPNPATAAEIWLSPVNNEKEINYKNVERTLNIIKLRPEWKLSMQMHKVIGVR